jgi:hypothetical protein
MNVARNAPTLAWLLTALACFLAGLAAGEGPNQAVALPDVPPVGVVVTVEVVFQPTSTAEPTPLPTPTPRRPPESSR